LQEPLKEEPQKSVLGLLFTEVSAPHPSLESWLIPVLLERSLFLLFGCFPPLVILGDEFSESFFAGWGPLWSFFLHPRSLTSIDSGTLLSSSGLVSHPTLPLLFFHAPLGLPSFVLFDALAGVPPPPVVHFSQLVGSLVLALCYWGGTEAAPRFPLSNVASTSLISSRSEPQG